jgi:hypothetical protein
VIAVFQITSMDLHDLRLVFLTFVQMKLNLSLPKT